MLSWFASLLLLPFAVITVFQTVTYALCLVINRKAGQLAVLKRENGGKLLFPLFRSLASSVAATSLLLPLFIFRKKNGLSCAGTLPSSGPVIVYVHGLYHNTSAWTVFKRRMAGHGLPHHCFWSYSSFSDDFFNLRRRLRNDLNRLFTQRPDCTFILIGHSLGGLMLRSVLPELKKGSVATLVTIAAPHRGSRLARFGMIPLALSLAPESDVIRSLPPDPTCPEISKLSLFSSIDNMVLPADACRIDAPGWIETNLGPVGHVAPLFYPTAPRLCATFIHADRPK